MGNTARVLGGLSVLAAPLAIGIGDQFRMAAENNNDVAVTAGDDLLAETTRQLASIDAHLGLFQTAAWFFYAAALLTIPALITIWRLSVAGSRKWAWAGATMAAIGVIGQTVHLTGYFALMQESSQSLDLESAAKLQIALDQNVFLGALFFVPFLLCALGCTLPQAIGLRRAGVIPMWACLALVAATLVMFVVGSVPWTSALWTVLMVAGFAPAALAAMRTPQPVRDEVLVTV
ncbi:MAG TPA: hypothetical protein VH419_09350 [Nocardioidaceae bacterium]|jgi:hypothetical protein